MRFYLRGSVTSISKKTFYKKCIYIKEIAINLKVLNQLDRYPAKPLTVSLAVSPPGVFPITQDIIIKPAGVFPENYCPTNSNLHTESQTNIQLSIMWIIP